MPVESFVFLFCAFILLAIPVLPALLELKTSSDAQPLPVHMGNSADPREALSALVNAGAAVLKTQDETHVGPQCQAKGAVCENKLWVEGYLPNLEAATSRQLVVESNAQVTAKLVANETAVVKKGARFKNLEAPRILISDDPTQSLFREPETQASLSDTPERLKTGSVTGGVWYEVQGWWSADKPAVVESSLRIKGDIIARQGLTIGESSLIEGSIRAHGKVVVGKRARVVGNIIAADVILEEGARVLGTVVASHDAELKKGSRVGTAEKGATLSADRAYLRPGAVVYGAIWTESEALTT